MSERPLFYELSREQLTKQLAAWGEPGFRARQIWHGIYGRLAPSPDGLTDLPADLRARLAGAFRFESLTPRAEARSADGGTEKLLLGLPDGQAIEAVLMLYSRRRTACISTQAGCAMGCVFCATGQMGFRRHLRAGEIVEQVLLFARRLAARGQPLTHVVVMGMGEPFHNIQATLEAIDRLNDPQGFGLGARRFTLSTVGLVPAIRRFARQRRQINLAVSLHAATDALRDTLLPVNRRYPLAELLPACREYVELTGRRITFEWALIEGVNDTPEQAAALADLVQGLTCHVNLIPLNPTRDYTGRAAGAARVGAFRALLEQRGVPCTVRLRRGIDIDAGCGQLAVRSAGQTSPEGHTLGPTPPA